MSATVPHFFLSYSRADWDIWLERFYLDLERAVNSIANDRLKVRARDATKGTEDEASGAFRDEASIKTGAAWYSAIVEAVSTAKLLVCIYTPRFFDKERNHEFCAKEFATFLMRGGLRYGWYFDGRKKILGVDKSVNVVPILWHGERVLVKIHNLPPEYVRSLKYDLKVEGSSRLNETYKTEGMLAITRRQRRGTYFKIVDDFALQIVEGAKNAPPPLLEGPDFETLFNPFWDPPPPWARQPSDAVAAAGAAPAVAQQAAVHAEPGQLVAIELRREVSATTDPWVPYPGAPSLAALVADMSHDLGLAINQARFDMTAADFLTAAGNLLEQATTHQSTPILFVDPSGLGNPTVRQAVRSLILLPWRGGVIIPASDRAAEQQASQFCNELVLPLDRAPDLVVRRDAPTTANEFRIAVTSVANEILAQIAQFGQVQRSPPFRDGPSSRPLINNTTRL